MPRASKFTLEVRGLERLSQVLAKLENIIEPLVYSKLLAV